MIEILKKLFGKKKEQPDVPNPPGRTFNRVLTGRYFGLEDVNADEDAIATAKQELIDQIKELELVPMYIRYACDSKKNKSFDAVEDHPTSAHVAFQKEIFAEKWNMVHVTEISFTVLAADFEEFEQMAGVSLHNDFRDLSSATFNGKERRREEREA